ncbi:MAG TPA: trimethylamine methyltransferase family protein, partial [Anaerolineae bacterium]|nr:trimethylamine methyltransferase family protein [Anaerolineae bacterium]
MRSNYQVNITPQFRVLSDSQIEEIFHSALEVLGRVGTRVHSDEALNLLREAGCQISDGDRARIPAWLVQDALTTTPQRIAIAGRDRSSRVILEKN